jgi:hypothetical protein
LTTREGQKTNRRTPEEKLITRGPTEHQRITSDLLVEVEQIGVVIPELVDLERAVMEDDGVFSSLPPPIVCVKFFPWQEKS